GAVRVAPAAGLGYGRPHPPRSRDRIHGRLRRRRLRGQPQHPRLAEGEGDLRRGARGHAGQGSPARRTVLASRPRDLQSDEGRYRTRPPGHAARPERVRLHRSGPIAVYIIVSGGGNVGYGIALELQQLPDYEVTIVEVDAARATSLRDELGEM